MPKKTPEPSLLPREFMSPEEIDAAVTRLRRRIEEIAKLDVQTAIAQKNGTDRVIESNVRTTLLEIFGENSPEYKEHRYFELWAGGRFMNMTDYQVVSAVQRGCVQAKNILTGLIDRLEEKKLEMVSGSSAAPMSYFDRLNLHSRIGDVSRDLFMDGHPWEAVFAASKALVNYVKERSGKHDLDGAPLMRTVFSKNAPVLVFNDLIDQTDFDEQEGMMHLFEGAVLAIRNPGGHSFPEGPEQRAIEYISFLSLLAYRLQEAKRRKTS
jgi:uncharacterized protein (TIGR02391 family)